MNVYAFVIAFILASPVSRATSAVEEPPSTPGDVGLYRACGLNCLSIILHMKGIGASLAKIEAELKPLPNGDSSVADLESAGRALGLDPISMQVDMQQLGAIPFPAIIQLRSRSPSSPASHYVVLTGLFQKGVAIIDAPRPLSYISYENFTASWTGVVVAFPSDEAGRRATLAVLNGTPPWLRWAPLAITIASAMVLAIYTLLLRRGATRKALGLGPLAASALLLAPLTGCGRLPSAPVFATSTPDVSMGVCEIGDISFSIPFENRGGSPLLIYGAKSSCSCTVTSVPDEPTVPGGRGQIRGKVSVRPGQGSAEVLVRTNEPGGGGWPIRVTWFGKHVPTLSPANILVDLRRGEVFEREVEVSYPGGADSMPLEFVGVDGLSDGGEMKLLSNVPRAIQGDPALAPISVAGQALFRLRAVAPDRVGDAVLTATVNVRHRSVDFALPLAIHMNVHDGLRASPGRLLFTGSSIKAIRSVERKIVLSSDVSPSGVTVEAKPDFLDVTLENGLNARAVATAHIAPSIRSGVSRGDLILRDRLGHRIIIPVFASCAP